MSVERLKHIKETLLCAIEGQMYNLNEVDAEELGEVVDMVKDIEEALYYCAVVEAMEEGSEKKHGDNGEMMMYYTPMYYGNGQMYYSGRGNGNYSSQRETNNTDGRDNRRNYSEDRMYYNGENGGGGGSSSSGSGSNGGNGGSSSSNGSSNGNSYYTEREYPHAFEDHREGKSYRSRRMYMEAKETHQDKTTQMRELEKYMQELTQDIVEMVEDSSPEEKQYLSKKVSALATKISQLNG